jgi:signal transduction histidine kinase
MFRPTLRMRLTLVYGGLFFLAGLVLLAVTYLLVERQIPRTGTFMLATTGPIDQTTFRTPNGDLINLADAPRYFSDRQASIRGAALESLLTQGAVALVLVGSAAAGLGWLIASRVLAPLHSVTETARRIANADAADRGLHERIALDGPHDDVKELADTFDTMVDRLDRSFDGQRRFVANASHELRTPLTLNRALVEVAMHRRSASADVRQLGETLLEINMRHERLIDGLLLLAQSENEVPRHSRLDLADVASHVVAEGAAEAAGLDVTVDVRPAEAPTTGDPIMLERLARNLVDNGVRHNRPGGTVHVATRPLPAGGAELTVENTGAVIPPYDIPVLFEPFRRQGEERLVTARGAGLGLSIVRSIARAHGGEVTARPRDGGGLVVTVTLPP